MFGTIDALAAAGRHERAVGAERHHQDLIGVAGKDRLLLAGGHVPQPHLLVFTGRGQQLPAGAERRGKCRLGVFQFPGLAGLLRQAPGTAYVAETKDGQHRDNLAHQDG